MNYDKLYEKDYIVEPEDISRFFCEISYADKHGDMWNCLAERSWFDDESDLIECIAEAMSEVGFILNEDMVNHCIKTYRLGAFFEEIHRIFTLAGIKHLIEFKEFE